MTADPSTPIAPPESQVPPLSVDWMSPRPLPVPDTSIPKMLLWTAFQATCSPIPNQSRRVSRYAAPRRRPASTAMATAPHRVASALPRWAAPNRSEVATSAARLPSGLSSTRSSTPRKAISSAMPGPSPMPRPVRMPVSQPTETTW